MMLNHPESSTVGSLSRGGLPLVWTSFIGLKLIHIEESSDFSGGGVPLCPPPHDTHANKGMQIVKRKIKVIIFIFYFIWCNSF